ncbi:MAG: hypothetical protein JNM98_18135 [Rhodocyclaceae bacterium]|nr:hypothetical protein [Rhodocyclaceae bacterium]
MALPYPAIEKLPNDEAWAVPSLWNVGRAQVDENFGNLDSRLSAREAEMSGARDGQPSLAVRLEDMEASIAATDVDMQNAVVATLKFAVGQAALANYEVRALRQLAQQEGVVTITNRGVVKGCTVTKSVTAARNLNIATGVCFANGRSYSVADGANAASVPSNIGSGAAVVYAYLYQDSGGLWRLAVTTIGAAVRSGAITLYSLTIPANSTDATDPNLSAVTLTDVRRVEPQFPMVMDSPATASIVLNTLSSNDYRVDFDIESAVGAPCYGRHIKVNSRATNGFTITLVSAADSVVVRWRASKLNN